MHHCTYIMRVPWCMPGSLTSGFLWSWWRGKRSRHSRRMRNPQFCVSGKRPIAVLAVIWSTHWMRSKPDPQVTSHTTELSIFFVLNNPEVIVSTEKKHVRGRICIYIYILYILNKKKRTSISTGKLKIVKTAQRYCLIWVKSAICRETSFA